MNEIMKIDSVQTYNDYFGVETRHPLVSVVDGREAKPLRFGRKLYGIYTVLLKDADCGNLKYGRSMYDYQRGTMLFIAPGQVMGSEDDGKLHQPEGWALCFHPEFLRKTPLAGLIKEYSYFSYNANEALHLSGNCNIRWTSTAKPLSPTTSSCYSTIANASTTVSSSPARI